MSLKSLHIMEQYGWETLGGGVVKAEYCFPPINRSFPGSTASNHRAPRGHLTTVLINGAAGSKEYGCGKGLNISAAL